MAFWDGTRWVRHEHAPPATRSHIANRVANTLMVIGLVGLIIPFQLIAAASHHRSDPPCSISPSPATTDSVLTLSATDLPSVGPVWLIVQPPSGGPTVSEVYVDQSSGTWSGTEFVHEVGTWTYSFSGMLTNYKYGTVSSCSVEVT
jgi:hypothetical protein